MKRIIYTLVKLKRTSLKKLTKYIKFYLHNLFYL